MRAQVCAELMELHERVGSVAEANARACTSLLQRVREKLAAEPVSATLQSLLLRARRLHHLLST